VGRGSVLIIKRTTATIVRVLPYSSTGSNTNHLGESKDKAGRADDRYIPVKVGTSELKEVERAIWRSNLKYEIEEQFRRRDVETANQI
jgi:hypothetical protein